MAKEKVIPPSLQPRNREKKPIPKLETPKPEIKQEVPKASLKLPKKIEPIPNVDKKRFTLWLSPDIYRAFKIHTATREGSSSDYIESLIRKDLKL